MQSHLYTYTRHVAGPQQVRLTRSMPHVRPTLADVNSVHPRMMPRTEVVTIKPFKSGPRMLSLEITNYSFTVR